MKARDFVYWLRGYFEINEQANPPSGGLSYKQVEMIKRHLSLVFVHEIDPSFGGSAVQNQLNNIHNGQKPETLHGDVYRC